MAETTALEAVFVTEIFRSLQGESTWAGLPCVFIRLSGCNLRCRYCDTTYAYPRGERMTMPAVAAAVAAFATPLVEITGGEPLLQPAAPGLASMLAASGNTVLVETNGSLLLPEDRSFLAIMDVKCPGSGEAESTLWENFARLRAGDELKFVVASRADFDYAVEVVREHGLEARGIPLLISPAADALAPGPVADWILASGLSLRLQLQLHRILWPARHRGV